MYKVHTARKQLQACSQQRAMCISNIIGIKNTTRAFPQSSSVIEDIVPPQSAVPSDSRARQSDWKVNRAAGNQLWTVGTVLIQHQEVHTWRRNWELWQFVAPSWPQGRGFEPRVHANKTGGQRSRRKLNESLRPTAMKTRKTSFDSSGFTLHFTNERWGLVKLSFIYICCLHSGCSLS